MHRPRTIAPRVASAGALAVATLGAALACGVAEAPPDDARAHTPAAGAAAADVAAGVAADTTPFAGTTASTTGAADGPVATLTAVRTAERSAGVERIVFEFAGDVLPGHAIAYDDAPRACGSGDAVEVAGDARLVVRLEPARAHSDAGESTIAARSLASGGAIVRELIVACDFEATVTWVLGVDRRRPYRVLTLRSPARLVVDVGGV